LKTFSKVRTSWSGLTLILYGNDGAMCVVRANSAGTCGIAVGKCSSLVTMGVDKALETFSKIRAG
jgi:hypothetical protein